MDINVIVVLIGIVITVGAFCYELRVIAYEVSKIRKAFVDQLTGSAISQIAEKPTEMQEEILKAIKAHSDVLKLSNHALGYNSTYLQEVRDALGYSSHLLTQLRAIERALEH
jgi:hypothetical protein